MTEAEWVTCSYPSPMLEFLRGKTSDRKLRLFAAACCRAIWDLVNDPRSRLAVDQMESYVDGLLSFEVMHTTHEAAAVAAGEGHRDYLSGNEYPSSAAKFASDTLTHGFWDVEHVVGVCAADAQWACAVAGQVGGRHDPDPITTVRAFQTSFIRDICGNPFHPIAADPAWRTSTAVALAAGIYAERAFDRMPILADALEDAGCDNADILGHCRGDGPHARGCWVVDLLLGKE